jgi:hypothetical protein
MELDTELRYYESHKADLLKAYKGQVALIRGEALVRIFPTEEEAYQVANRQFGNLPTLVVRVEEGPTPHPAGQRLLRHTGFGAQAGMTDEDMDQFVAAIYEERAHQRPREVDFD